MSDPEQLIPAQLQELFRKLVADGIHPSAASTIINFRYAPTGFGLRDAEISGVKTHLIIVTVSPQGEQGFLAWIPAELITQVGNETTVIGVPPKGKQH